MSGTTSSAEPDRLAAYETAVAPVDEALALSTLRFATAIGAFFAGAGSFAPPGSAEEWAAPLLSVRAESSYLASWVTAVGEAFRQAGADPDGDGIYGYPTTRWRRWSADPSSASSGRTSPNS